MKKTIINTNQLFVMGGGKTLINPNSFFRVLNTGESHPVFLCV